MRLFKSIAICLVLALDVAWLALAWAACPSSSDRFVVAYLGATNDASGVRRVLLGFTNDSRSTPVCTTVFTWETKRGESPEGTSARDYFFVSPVLTPGQSAVMAIPAPLRSPWRGKVVGCRTGWRLQLGAWLESEPCPPWIRTFLPESAMSGYHFSVQSDWINQ